MKRLHLACATFLAAGLAFPGAAFAGVILNVEEVGGDVVISGGGTLDLGAWTLGKIDGNFPHIFNDSIAVGPEGNGDFYDFPENFAGPATIPVNDVFADSGTGDIFGITFFANFIVVPENYISGDPLSGDATYVGQTIASMGLIAGESYTWTWGTLGGNGGNDDFFTLNIIPAPGALALLGMAGFATSRRRRR